MRALTRLVWSEGMYLSPHHFQRQSRYFEDSLWFAATSLWFKPYGLAGCRMDADALQNGTVSVLHARGVFPDGLCFDIPGCDSAPEPHNIASSFSPTRDSHTVLLGIPAWRQDRKNVSGNQDPDRNESRYLVQVRAVADEVSGRDEKSVELGRKNLQLFLDTEVTEEMITLPVARVRRDGAGRFIYDSRFVPPLLQISASDRVMSVLHELCELIDRKGRTIKEPRKDQRRDRPEFYRGDFSDFWFLHTLNSNLPALRHILLTKKSHPEELFQELSRLAGALCCFGSDSDPRDLPAYNHDDFGICLDLLDRKIRAGLEGMLPTNCISIPLKPTSTSFWSASVDDPRYFEPSRWILSIASKTGEANIVSKTPHLVKVCSEKFVGELVRRALPGLELKHLPIPPPGISPTVESFVISREGPCWEHILKTKQVGVYVPGDLPDPTLQLHILLGP
jgi:type VI secretion system protein ImpJ